MKCLLKLLPVLLALGVVVPAAEARSRPLSFVVGASAIVMPTKPSLAPGATNIRGVYRLGKGVYCVRVATSFDWSLHTPLVAPLARQSLQATGTLLASWDAGGRRCPATAIQVRTYRVVGGAVRPANDVAFHLLVGGAG